MPARSPVRSSRSSTIEMSGPTSRTTATGATPRSVRPRARSPTSRPTACRRGSPPARRSRTGRDARLPGQEAPRPADDRSRTRSSSPPWPLLLPTSTPADGAITDLPDAAAGERSDAGDALDEEPFDDRASRNPHRDWADPPPWVDPAPSSRPRPRRAAPAFLTTRRAVPRARRPWRRPACRPRAGSRTCRRRGRRTRPMPRSVNPTTRSSGRWPRTGPTGSGPRRWRPA